VEVPALGTVRNGNLRVVSRHRVQGRRDRADSLLLWRCVRSRARHVPPHFRLGVSRQTVSRLVGHLRPRLGEPEPAGVCGDVGRGDEIRTGSLQLRLPACGLPGNGLPQRTVSGAEPGVTERHHLRPRPRHSHPDGS
jgi:hypothetical protein